MMSTFLKPVFVGLALLALLGFGVPIHADVVTVQLHGHILPFDPGNPTVGLDITGVFGAPNTYLNGDAYSATIVYDTGLAPATLYPGNPAYAQYERDYGASSPPFLNISVTINGHTETVTGDTNYERVDVGYSTQDSLLFATSNHGHVLAPGAPFDESYADFFFYSLSGQHLVPSDALPTSVNLAALLPPGAGKIGDLLIVRGVYGSPTNTYTAQTNYLYLGLDAIDSWSAVPEPTTVTTLAAAIVGLVCIRHRRC
jgi:hypothetical protein